MGTILLSEHEIPATCKVITVNLPAAMNARSELSLLRKKARLFGPRDIHGLNVTWSWNASEGKLTAICNPSDELAFACINALLILRVPLKFVMATPSSGPCRG